MVLICGRRTSASSILCLKDLWETCQEVYHIVESMISTHVPTFVSILEIFHVRRASMLRLL